MLLYVHFTDQKGVTQSRVYHDWNAYHSATWNPNCKIHQLIDFLDCPGSYTVKKEHARKIAIEFSRIDKDYLGWGELAEIYEWLEITGRRYGLTREFKKSGIM